MRLAALALLAAACGEDIEPGKVARVGGDTYALGDRIEIRVGEHEHFRQHYRFHADRGESIPILAETPGMMLEVSIGLAGERKAWKRGPQSDIRDRFRAPQTGEYELEIFGDGLTYDNTVGLVVGEPRRR